MRIPNIISRNSFRSYQLIEKYVAYHSKLKSYNFLWDNQSVKPLRCLCIKAIKRNWKDHQFYIELPLLTDKQYLAEILSCDLDLNLTVPIIHDDYFWERCYRYRWAQSPRPIKYIRNIEQFYTSSIPQNIETANLVNNETNVLEEETSHDFNLAESKDMPNSCSSISSKYSSKTYMSQTEIKSPVNSQITTPSKISDATSVKVSNNRLRRNSNTSRKLSLANMSTRKLSTYDTVKNKNYNFEELDEPNINFIEVPLLKSWKTCYLEKYFQEKLQNLQPTHFNQEVIKEFIDLVVDYIYSLKLHSLKAANPTQQSPLQYNDHIPLDVIVGSLSNLFELCICFNEDNLEDQFSEEKTNVSERDCKLLGNGLEKSDVKIFRILKSNINYLKLELFVRPLVKNSNLRILDLSHCKIGDEGVEVLVNEFKNHQSLESLILINNKIGHRGAEHLSEYIKETKSKSGLINLNLKLNIIGDNGCSFLANVLSKDNRTIKSVTLASSGITGSSKCLSKLLKLNNSIEKIDLSNNDLGGDFADMLMNDIQSNKTIIYVNLRMCNIPTAKRVKLEHILKENWKVRRTHIIQPSTIFEMPFSII